VPPTPPGISGFRSLKNGETFLGGTGFETDGRGGQITSLAPLWQICPIGPFWFFFTLLERRLLPFGGERGLDLFQALVFAEACRISV